MNNLPGIKKFYPFVTVSVIISLIAICWLYKIQTGEIKVSKFGKYQGYSKAIYDGNKRISDYLTLSDGAKLAYDLIIPTKKGIPAKEPLPVLFKYTPYLRTFTIFDKEGKNLLTGFMELNWFEKAMLRLRYRLSKEGSFMDPIFRTKWLRNMIEHGYAVIVVERPGTGASFGVLDATMEVGAKETDEIINWIAAQTWCDGNIGMYGESFHAMTQFAAASKANPHLKAIFPASGAIDMYSAIQFPGGVYNKAFNSFYMKVTSFLEKAITPVDSDHNGALLEQALKERSKTLGERTAGFAKDYPFRDNLTSGGKNFWRDKVALYPFIERINQSGIPIYMSTGWYDIFSADMFYWYENLTVPKRLTVRPLDHSGMDTNQFDLDYAAEAQRWFDYWLKGIANGIMDEPPIHYYTMGVPQQEAWRTSNTWPLQHGEQTPFYFGQGKTGSIASVNDGFLTLKSPIKMNAFDDYTVDYTTTSGKKSRWVSVDETQNYPDMSVNDRKALTYTTTPLKTDTEITGHPLVYLWLATTAPDLDLFVYLEEVDRNGKSTYITEGNLRASHRKLSQALFKNLGLPYHSHYQSDLESIKEGEPTELIFSMLPTSYKFRRGNRIRITVTCADADNFETTMIKPAPNVKLLRDIKHPSFVELPVIKQNK